MKKYSLIFVLIALISSFIVVSGKNLQTTQAQIKIDNSSSFGAITGTIIDDSQWPIVTVKIKNEHRYWTKLNPNFKNLNVKVEKMNVWAKFGYVPGESEAIYQLTFDSQHDSYLILFSNASRPADDSLPAGVFTILQRTIDVVTTYMGGVKFVDADPSSIELVLREINNLPDCVNAGDALARSNYIGFASSLQKCVWEDNQAAILASMISKLGTNVTKDQIKNVIFTPLKLTQYTLDLWDSLWSIVKGSYAGSVLIYSEVDHSATPPPIQTPTPVPFPTPSSTDNASFVGNISITDGSIVTPNQSITKTWRMRNIGTSSWGNGYQLVFVSGEQMGAQSEINVPATNPNQEINLSVNIITPTTPGEHVGYWQLRNPQGTYFGPKIYIDIIIQDGAPPPPAAEYSLKCTNCPATVEPGAKFFPVIEATIGSGQLLETRGDMLRNTDGNLFGAYPHVAVTGEVNTGQTYDFTFYTEYPITAPSSEGTYQTKWQLWQNGQFVGPELTIQFDVKQGGGTNHPPNSPTLKDPGDWAVFDGTTPTLMAQDNGDPDGDAISQYYFEIFDSHDIPNSGWISSNSWNPPGLGNYGYQWHVKVRDSRGAESDWSETRHFNIKNPTPQIYSFSWQWCRDSWGGPEKVCFCAQTSGGGLNLKLNSANDGSENGTWKIIGDADTNINCNTDSDRPVNWGQLEVPAGSYRVRLYQQPNVGGWDAANTADIVVPLPANQRPGSPDILEPLYDSYINTTSIHIVWKTTYRTTNYHLFVSTDPNFSSPLVDQTFPVGTTSFDFNSPSEFETIYVKVISTGPYGTNENQSRFHIDTTPPASNMSALPDVTTDNTFTVNWNGSDARAGLRWYDIQVKDGDRPDSQWQDWQVDTGLNAAIYEGQPGHTYYFRARAMDNVGNWEGWPGGNGDTFTKVDPTSAPQTPWWDQGYAYKRNLVVLNNDSDTMPQHFPVHIQFNGSTTPTSTEIYNASMSSTKGNDVRIIFNNTTEIDRFVQRFSPDQIDIWFPLQNGLGGGLSNNSDYQIYYGNPNPGNPPADINTIFLPISDSNTMALWHFQEGSSNTIYDTSGRGHNGQFYNAGWADGLFGNAGAFNGSNAYVEVPNSGDMNPGAITLEAWIYLNGDLGSHPMIISKDYYWFQVTNDRKLWFGINADGGNRIVANNTTLNMNQWYHVAATYDGNGHMKIYVNGIEDGHLDDSPLTILYTNLPFRIGRLSNVDPSAGQYFPGYIQNVRVSNIARTNFSYGRIDIQPTVVAGIQQTPPINGKPDLAVLSMTTYPATDSGSILEALVKNQGTVSTQSGFYTDLYVNHLPSGAGDYTGSLSFWVNDPIAAGSVVTLTTKISQLPGLMNQALSPASETTSTLYAQVDSSDSVNETNNANNIFSDGLDVCIATPDAYEVDDTIAGASTINLWQTQLHNFDSLSDMDWIKFDATAGITYTLQTSNLGNSADTYLYLYDRDGVTLLASNDDFGNTLASRIEWNAPASGTYYVLVRHWNPNVSGCGTRYNFIVRDGYRIFLPSVTRK